MSYLQRIGSSCLFLIAGGASVAQPVVTGTVLGPGRLPLTGVRAELLPIEPRAALAESNPPAVTQAATDAAGRFGLEAPSPGLWRVVVRGAEGLVQRSAPLPLVDPFELPPLVLSDAAVANRDGEVAPPGEAFVASPLVLSGEVIDAGNRKPIPGALVWATADPGAFTLTDAEGRFQITAPGRQRFELRALAPGHLLKRLVVTRPQIVSRRTGPLALARAGRLQGKVMDSQGRPLAGATVVAVSEDVLGERAFSSTDTVTDRAVTGFDGRFDLRHVRPEQVYKVRAARAGAFPAAQLATVGPSVARPCELRLVLTPSRGARGLVQDPSGQPIQDAEVTVRPAPRPGSPGGAPEETGTTARTGARGTFSLPELPAAEVEVSIRRSGFAPLTLPALRIAGGQGAADLGTITLRPGAALRGRVFDHHGQPIGGAAVFLLNQPIEAEDLDLALEGGIPAATTGRDGGFMLEDLAEGAPVQLAVRVAGHRVTQVRGARPPASKPILIRLEPEAELRGRVVDEKGKPVPRARVDLAWQEHLPEEPDLPVGQPVQRSARADGDGRFELRGIPHGFAKVTATAPGFAPLALVEVELPRPATLDELRLVLERGAFLQGRVASAAGEPMPAVRVDVRGSSALTDDSGAYWLEGATLGVQRVLFLHPSYGRVERPFKIEPGINMLDLTLEPGIEVAGRVVDAGGGPISRARVTLLPEDRVEPKEYRALTAEDGGFLLAPVLAGRYRLQAAADGFTGTELPRPLVVASEPMSDLEITLDRGAVITGRVLGLPPEELARVQIRANCDQGSTAEGWTDGLGRFEIRSVAPGDWTVLATLWDDQREARARIAIGRSDREVTRDLEFEKRLALAIQVLTDEEPLREALVSLRGRSVSVERTATTDFEGRVRFDDLIPETYRLGVRHARSLRVHNDEVHLDQDQELVLRLQGAAITGLVVSAADGQPVRDALLELRPLDGPEYLVTTGTKADGRFALHRLQPNLYRLRANHSGFLPIEQEVRLGAGESLEGLELRLQPEPGARVRVRLASGQVPALVHLRILNEAGATVLAESQQVDAAGEVELSSLPAGKWTLHLRADDSGMASAGLSIPTSEPPTLTLPPAGQLSVRIPALVTSDQIGTVRLLGVDQQPFRTLFAGGHLVGQWPLVGGKAMLDGVPAGFWLLVVEAPDGQRWQGGVVTSGTAETAIRLE